MRHVKSLLTIIVLSLAMVTSCKEELRPANSLTPNGLQSGKSARLSAEMAAKLAAFNSTLPKADKARIEQLTAHILAKHSEYQQRITNRVNAVTPTPCGPTTFDTWLNQELADWTVASFYHANATAMFDLPTYDALVFENSSSNQYFGKNGEYSQRLTKTFKDLKRFWNIQSERIVLAAMHGGMLRDRGKLIRTYRDAFGFSQADSEYLADYVLLFLQVFPEYRNGDHPIFTLNAFAQSGFDYIYGPIPDKIIMGDGIQEAYTALGHGDVAPQAILAHEFGHHIQFQLGLFGTGPDSPEATRRTELMADAYSAYFLSHARGAAMQWKRVKEFLQVFFTIGDCAFTSDGHHGTPLQRMAAAEWGYSVANDAQRQGHILTGQEFDALFEAQLPILVAPPAP